MILVYTTFSDFDEAEKIIKVLLQEKLIACANVREHKAFYTWHGKLNIDDEIGAILKTKEENWIKVKEKIKQLHSYETPVILKIKVEDLNDEAKKWLDEVVI